MIKQETFDTMAHESYGHGRPLVGDDDEEVFTAEELDDIIFGDGDVSEDVQRRVCDSNGTMTDHMIVTYRRQLEVYFVLFHFAFVYALVYCC